MQKELEVLQDRYLQERTEVYFNELYRKIYLLARMITIRKLKRAGVYDVDKVEIVSSDASSMFMMQYVKKPEWRCQYFQTRLSNDVFHCLHNKNKCNDYTFYAKNKPLNDKILFIPKQIETKTDIMDILQEDKQRSTILLSVYKVNTIESFLIELSHIKSIAWIKENIKALIKLYNLTRVKHGKKEATRDKGNLIRKNYQRNEEMAKRAL